MFLLKKGFSLMLYFYSFSHFFFCQILDVMHSHCTNWFMHSTVANSGTILKSSSQKSYKYRIIPSMQKHYLLV